MDEFSHILIDIVKREKVVKMGPFVEKKNGHRTNLFDLVIHGHLVLG